MEDQLLAIEGGPMGARGSVNIQQIPLNKIKISRNSRMMISNEELDGLMSSIKEEGLLQPIGVVKNGTGYQVCYGNRRFLACSKLGMTKIPAVIHENSKVASDIDIKNLAENIQRRPISLQEAGRYMTLLQGEGLKQKEIAIRLGVSNAYVDSCVKAYREVPEEFRNDLEIAVGGKKLQPGKISIKTAKAILNAGRSFRLSAADEKALFQAAKGADGFIPESIPKYAGALARGKKDFLNEVKPLKRVHMNILLTEKEFERLEKEFVLDGPYKSVTELLISIPKGERAVRVKVEGRF